MDISKLLFYVGLAGMALSLLVGTPLLLIIMKTKKVLNISLVEEYGENDL